MPIRNDEAPIYEDLVRERGDAVAEARTAAERTQYQAAQLLPGHDMGRPDRGAGQASGW
ncbi:hypothetical protein ACIHEJ_37140 [Streptomyces sp. NPDC052301]|uniref:hypothetical protein n=1 Tax=Streptomyces sp. NPDC052301 TaxID=3365687 RepID=UPI0037D34E5A